MSVIKNVSYEIEPFGNCWNCECLKELKHYKSSHVCLVFGDEIINCETCQACKDFLAQEKAMVKCKGCKNLKQFTIEHIPQQSKCKIGNIIINHEYSLNCQDRSE